VPQHFRVRLGDAVRLPCEVDELGPGYTLLWKREEGDILTAGSVLVSYFSFVPYVNAVRHRVVFPISTHSFTFAFSLSAFLISHFTHASLLCSVQVLIVKDPRISHEGNNLVIRNISLFDQGSYICQISTQDQRELRHVIEILGMYQYVLLKYDKRKLDNFEFNCSPFFLLYFRWKSNFVDIVRFFLFSHGMTVPPSVKTMPSSGVLVVKKGEPVTLSCDVTGNPLPVVTWTREVCMCVFMCVEREIEIESSQLHTGEPQKPQTFSIYFS